MSTPNDDNKVKIPTGFKGFNPGGFVSFIIAVIWVIAGVLAFFKSLSCAASDTARGSVLQKILGFLVAIFFGPFYWIFYFMSPTYCR